jgi:hypothetical protein
MGNVGERTDVRAPRDREVRSEFADERGLVGLPTIKFFQSRMSISFELAMAEGLANAKCYFSFQRLSYDSMYLKRNRRLRQHVKAVLYPAQV